MYIYFLKLTTITNDLTFKMMSESDHRKTLKSDAEELADIQLMPLLEGDEEVKGGKIIKI